MGGDGVVKGGKRSNCQQGKKNGGICILRKRGKREELQGWRQGKKVGIIWGSGWGFWREGRWGGGRVDGGRRKKNGAWSVWGGKTW